MELRINISNHRSFRSRMWNYKTFGGWRVVSFEFSKVRIEVNNRECK